MATILLCDGPPEVADFLARFAHDFGHKLRVSQRFQRKHWRVLTWDNVDPASPKPRYGPWRLVMRKRPVDERRDSCGAVVGRWGYVYYAAHSVAADDENDA